MKLMFHAAQYEHNPVTITHLLMGAQGKYRGATVQVAAPLPHTKGNTTLTYRGAHYTAAA